MVSSRFDVFGRIGPQTNTEKGGPLGIIIKNLGRKILC